jgi:hypothetical protein
MLVGGLAFASEAQAVDTTFTWDGGGSDTNWSTADNWNPDAAPAASQYQGGNALIITGLTSSVVDLTAAVRIKGLSFGAAGTYTLSGSDLAYMSSPTFGYTSGSTITVENNISFAAGFGNMNTSGTLNFNGNLSGTWGGNLRGGASQIVTLAGDNSALSASSLFDLQTGATLVLASDTATGSGVVRMGDNNANASGIVNVSGDRDGIFNLQVNSGSTWVPGAPATRAARITGGNLATSGTLDLAYNATAAGNNQYLRIENTQTDVSGAVMETSASSGKSFHKYGAGTLKLSGAAENTAPRTLTINAGTVDFAKTAAVNAWAADVIVNPGGTLKSSGAGQDVAGSVSFAGTAGNLATLSITLTGGGTTGLDLTGNVDLSGAFDQLSVTGVGTISDGRYVFLTYDGTLNGTFNAFTKLGTLLPAASLDYSQPGEIAVLVPEPASVGLLFAAGLLAMSRPCRVRSRRKAGAQ